MTARASKPAPREVKLADVEAIIARGRLAPLSDEDCEVLVAMATMLAYVTALVNAKRVSIKKLKQLIFGAKTEKTKKVLGDEPAKPPAQPVGADAGSGEVVPAPSGQPRPGGEDEPVKVRKGHGRNGAEDYPGGTRIPVPHPTLKCGDSCAKCSKGTLFRIHVPSTMVRITGSPLLVADVLELEQLRCSACGIVARAPAPPGVGTEKYDATATAMIGEARYGSGFTFSRVAKLQQTMGVPLPVSTQWDLVEDGARKLLPVVHELKRQAAQCDVLYNDDTGVKILELTPEVRAQTAADEGTNPARTGTFTTAIVATKEKRVISLFFSGVQHAGENFADVLKHRAAGLPPPIQMCDALARNVAAAFAVILAKCLAHARRKYVEVAESFPGECRIVLECLSEVYRNDAIAREQKLSPEARLLFHKTASAPVMKKLEEWMEQAFKEHRVEPNSGLGDAIKYMTKHWGGLTLFLREAGAPLDNNICERALKRAIIHRKNSLFYKTLNGALVGDVFMSLIHTAERNGISSFDYLVTLLRRPAELRERPSDWMPWNYKATLARLQASPSR